MRMLVAVELRAGGAGSGCKGPNCGRPAGRAARARATFVLMTKEKRRDAETRARVLARAIGGKATDDNQPFDVLIGRHGIELKTIQEGKNDKITMHPDSLARKIHTAKKMKIEPHTVVFDTRGGKVAVYYRQGVGSFRLKHMEKTTLSGIRRRLQQ